MTKLLSILTVLAVTAVPGSLLAAPVLYTIEPLHTYPSFKASHMGISFWRGKFDKSSGTIVLDRERGTGTVDVEIDPASVDFGLPILDQVARGPELFDVAKYPAARYQSDSITFRNGVPVAVNGRLALHGVTKAVPLKIDSFKCIMHPFFKREVCGADATADFNRMDFGMTNGVEGDPTVHLYIQVEALKGKGLPPMGPIPGATGSGPAPRAAPTGAAPPARGTP